MAAGWERRRAEIEKVSRSVSEWMVQALDPQPGDTVLELAAGPGDTGFLAAPLLGEEGRLISSDFSSEMVEVARRRAAELGLENVEHRVDRRRGDRARRRLRRRRPLPFRLHAHARSRRGARRDPPRPAAGWTSGARRLEHRRTTTRGSRSPAGFSPSAALRRRRSPARQGCSCSRNEDAPARAPRRRRLQCRASRGGACALRVRRRGRLHRAIERTRAACSRGSGATLPTSTARAITARLAEDFAPFAVDGGYELPGVAVVAVAS